MSFIRVSATTYQEVLECLKNQKKIQAIKKVRTDVKCGLREAKEAVERLAHESGINPSYPGAAKTGSKIVCGPIIRKMVLNFGHGDIELDIEGMQLKALMDMQVIGLDACRDILDLVDTLQAFSDGKRIGVLEESEDGEEV